MIPRLVDIGPLSPWAVLPPGVHDATLAEIEMRLATTSHRRRLFEGFARAVAALEAAGCKVDPMIANEKQYRSTRALIERLRASLDALPESQASEVHPVLVAAQRAALDSQIAELAEDVARYDDLRSGHVTAFEANGLHDLPDILIQARIARGLSQKDLAGALGLKEQQIQRYEAKRYRSASLNRLVEVADALKIKIRETAELLGEGKL